MQNQKERKKDANNQGRFKTPNHVRLHWRTRLDEDVKSFNSTLANVSLRKNFQNGDPYGVVPRSGSFIQPHAWYSLKFK